MSCPNCSCGKCLRRNPGFSISGDIFYCGCGGCDNEVTDENNLCFFCKEAECSLREKPCLVEDFQGLRRNPWKDDGISGYMFTPAKREKRRFDALVERLAVHLDDAVAVLTEMTPKDRAEAVFMAIDGPHGLICLEPDYTEFDLSASARKYYEDVEDDWIENGNPKSLALGAVGYLSENSDSVLGGPHPYHIRSEMVPKGGWSYMSHITGYRGLAPGSAFYFAQYIGMDALEEALDLADSMSWREYFRYTQRRRAELG